MTEKNEKSSGSNESFQQKCIIIGNTFVTIIFKIVVNLIIICNALVSVINNEQNEIWKYSVNTKLLSKQNWIVYLKLEWEFEKLLLVNLSMVIVSA